MLEPHAIPTEETTGDIPSPKSLRARRWLFAWFALCTVISFAGNLLLPKTIAFSPRFWQPVNQLVLTGGLLAQFATVGSWMALSRWTRPYRFLSGITLGVLLPLALIGGMNWAFSKKREIPVSLFIFMLLAGVAIHLIGAWLISQFLRGRKAVLPNAEADLPGEVPPHNKQYGLRFLLAAMGTTAVLSQAMRANFPKSEVSWLGAWADAWIALWLLWLILGLSVLAWLHCLIVLEPRRRWWMWIAWLVCVVFGPLLFQTVSAYGIFGGTASVSPWFFSIAYWIELGLVLGLLLALMGARWIGVRLESRDDQRGQPTDDPPASYETASITPE